MKEAFIECYITNRILKSLNMNEGKKIRENQLKSVKSAFLSPFKTWATCEKQTPPE